MSNCEFCNRDKELTFHHYIPKTLHSNKYFKREYKSDYMNNYGIYLCQDCHKAIHNFFTEKELGKYYNNKQKLISSEKVRNFIKWVKKQHFIWFF